MIFRSDIGRGVLSSFAFLALCACSLSVSAPDAAAQAQIELLPLDHPATRLLIRLYEYGLIPSFPREHLPISRKLAIDFLRDAEMSKAPESMRAQRQYYLMELAGINTPSGAKAIIDIGDRSKSIIDEPLADKPLVLLVDGDVRYGFHIVAEPVLDAELRVDPDNSLKALVGQGGLQVRGTVLDHVGFSARVTNGSVAGDSALAARDPRIRRSGSFGITAFGRDISYGDGHLRVGFDYAAAEIGREKIQLGAGLSESLLLGSVLPSKFDYLRFNIRVKGLAFSHIHAALLGEAVGDSSGPAGNIPAKYLAAHLLSFGFEGIRLSLGESVIYHGRGFEIGYLNPFVFMKTEEQYLRDRDNANLYMALSVAPLSRLFLEGELLIDDLRFSLIGDGFWGNKTAWRVSAKATAFPLDAIDLGLGYTRLEPYVYTHFNRLNNYTHDATLLAAAGMQPNSYLIHGTIGLTPLPNLWIRGTVGLGEHGANIMGKNGAGEDTLLFNAGGDAGQTRRYGLDSDRVNFLDGEQEKLLQLRLEAEYEPIRSLYLRLNALRYQTRRSVDTETDTQIWFGVRVGAY